MPAQKNLKLGTLYRTAVISRTRAESDDDDEIRFELAFSSEEPYERGFGIEILDHSEKSVNMDFLKSGNAPLLLGHNMDDQIGVIENARIDKDKVARATVRFGFSQRARDAALEVEKGIFKNISVGYRVNSMILEKEQADGPNTYRVDDWSPLEISVVSIPADQKVGFGKADNQEERPVEIRGLISSESVTKSKVSDDQSKNLKPKESEMTKPNEGDNTPTIDVKAIAAEAVAAEQTRSQGIIDLGRQVGAVDVADKFIKDNATLDSFRSHVLENLDKYQNATRKVETADEIGLNDKEIKSFSFVRALNALANPGDRRAQENAAFEIEASDAAAKLYGKQAQGILVPNDILKRDLVVGTPTAGGNLVSTDLLPGSFIDMLRNKVILSELGATYLSGLVGDLAIPRQTGGATAYWLGEAGSVTKSQQAVDQVALTPKTLAAETVYSRALMNQSSLDVEAFIRGDLARTLGLEVSRAALYGSGASNQPTGVANQSGINTGTASFAGAFPTFAEIVDMESVVAADDADVGNLAYVLNAQMRGAMKTTVKESGQASYVWEIGNTLNGNKTAVSNQVVDGDVFFGNWSDVLIGMWSGVDLLVNPYSEGSKRNIIVNVFQDMDIAVRQPESFCLNNDGV